MPHESGTLWYGVDSDRRRNCESSQFVSGTKSNFLAVSGIGVVRCEGRSVLSARAPPGITEWVIEPRCDAPFPDYDAEPVMMYANG